MLTEEKKGTSVGQQEDNRRGRTAGVVVAVSTGEGDKLSRGGCERTSAGDVDLSALRVELLFLAREPHYPGNNLGRKLTAGIEWRAIVSKRMR